MGSGAFSFWFVIPAAIAGATYGLLHKPSLFRIFIVNIVVVVGVSFLFNTRLIAYVYHLNYEALLTTRIFKMITSLIVQVIVTYMLLNHTAMINLKKQR